jgi:hypothetical protein
MNIQIVRFYTVLVLGLSVAGFFVSGHLLKIMNVDIALDLFRLALGIMLLRVAWMAMADYMEANFALIVVALLYLGLAIAGIFSPDMGGLLPSKLTGFDIGFHIVTGLLALGAAWYKPGRQVRG